LISWLSTPGDKLKSYLSMLGEVMSQSPACATLARLRWTWPTWPLVFFLMAFFFESLKPWDVAAGSLLVQELSLVEQLHRQIRFLDLGEMPGCNRAFTARWFSTSSGT
jgi:myo-inositol-1(or 4)-monophosphatase